jgi:predicted secreted protein
MVARFSTIKDYKNISRERRQKRNEQSMKDACEEFEVSFARAFQKLPLSILRNPSRNCHSERSEESLTISPSVSVTTNQRCFASLNMTAPAGRSVSLLQQSFQ